MGVLSVKNFEVRRFMLKGLADDRGYLWDEVESESAASLDAATERIQEAVGKGVPLKKTVRRYAKTDDDGAMTLMDRFLRQGYIELEKEVIRR